MNVLLVASLDVHKEVVRLLLEKGADVNAGSETHPKALLAASFNGHEEAVQFLLEKGEPM